MIRPRMRVARFSFFLARRRLSRSVSRGFGGLISITGHSFILPESAWSLFNLLAAFRPNIGWQRRSFNGFTTAQRETTPLSDDDGSNSETMSTSIPTLGARHRTGIVCVPSPFTDNDAFRFVFCTWRGTLT